MNTVAPERIIHSPTADEISPLSYRLDYYKPTMSQLAFETELKAEVTYSFKNRGGQDLSDYVPVDDLASRLENVQRHGFGVDEIRYLGGLCLESGGPVFSHDFLDYLEHAQLPDVTIEQTDDLSVETTGDWPTATFWETVILSEVNEIYFENYLKSQGLDPFDVYTEGDRRLTHKIDILKANPNIKFADFGTRRHFSVNWQKHVLNRLMRECPASLVGTSNVGLAAELGLRPIGTFAHEMPMVYAGLAESRGEDIRISHNQFLEAWLNRYGNDYAIALTDTFGTDFFFTDFTPDQAELWRGVRHDSGDPYKFGEKVIDFYEHLGIDPSKKTIVFSDGLDIEQIQSLNRHFSKRINVIFGWGTSLTNDLGIKALNIVVKATRVNGISTVKLSDDIGKHTGASTQIKKYQEVFG